MLSKYVVRYAHPADLNKASCLLNGIQELCKKNKKLSLAELEQYMAKRGFSLSYEALFAALIFLEERGIASVRIYV